MQRLKDFPTGPSPDDEHLVFIEHFAFEKQLLIHAHLDELKDILLTDIASLNDF